MLPPDHLTARQLQVLDLLLRGRTSKQIGVQLSISYRTVEVHREHIRLKLGARTTAELAVLAATGRPWHGFDQMASDNPGPHVS